MISYDYEDSGYDDDVTAISTKLLLILMFVKRKVLSTFLSSAFDEYQLLISCWVQAKSGLWRLNAGSGH